MSRVDGFSIPRLTAPQRVDSSAVAVRQGAISRTYGELEAASNRVADGLRNAGLKPGERVVFVGRNGFECIEILLGASKIGAVPTFLNWRLHSRELALLLEDSAPRIAFVDAAFVETFAVAAAQGAPTARVLTIGPEAESNSYAEWRDGFEPCAEFAEEHPGDIALQLYTSGTTGRPKGAMLTRAGFTAAIPDAVEFWEISTRSVVLSVLPMFHIAGIGTVLGTLWAGGQLLINNDARPETTLSDIETSGVTHLVLASVMLQALVSSPAYPETNLSTLETVSYGAAPISASVLRQIMERMKCRVLQPYGLTETTGVLTLLDDDDHRRFASIPAESNRLGSCGKARPGVELKIVDPVTGKELGEGVTGELWARSDRLMRGYANLPGETAEVLLPGGWFRTGDIAQLDGDGYVTLKDRLKDIIISGGENIYPVEVENMLLSHPDIADVAVVGMPHEKWGETPVAVVVPAEGAKTEAACLIEFARSRLAHYKCPGEVQFVSELPRNATGKVLRKQLREDTSWRK